jgi:hypothetical protein
LIPLAKVAKILPPELRNVHASTAARWALRGIGNPRVKLGTLKIGGRRFVNRELVAKFVAALSRMQGAGEDVFVSSKRQKQMRDADAILDAAGVE